MRREAKAGSQCLAADADLQPLKEARLEYGHFESAPRATTE
jgi:hypothetical protein